MLKSLRYLRIAFSAVCVVACVLLLVFWVRSYWGRKTVEFLVTSADRYYLHSLKGTVVLEKSPRYFIGFELQRMYEESDFDHLATNTGIRIWRDSRGGVYALSVSYWLLELVTILAAVAPWVRWRFGLRTLLIATTLIAEVLGAIGYAVR